MSAFTNLVCQGDTVKMKEYLEDPTNEVADRQTFLNERNKSGKSALDFAAILGREDAIRLLIEWGADLNSSTKKGYSVLHRAASWGHLDCVKMLVNLGVDLQVTNVHGERAREAAARYGKQDCVDFLDRAEAIAALQTAIQDIKSTVTDPEKNLGRLNKEDKLTGNKLCDEKNTWLMANKDTASVELIFKKKDELYEAMHYIFLKLEDLEIEKKR
ncbi:ankyrin repeat domain-containing protein 45-like [Dendronephthya gigantea]|uniref:ankyrin repeat domain-containing protein 45-like n=1 Tax=Dendronephthya gigantea TaxID=151771 RepID=UPI00106BA953|nr:ankyrin repeat domain-containing protein 45-like [Dendronephthya gigantea]